MTTVILAIGYAVSFVVGVTSPLWGGIAWLLSKIKLDKPLHVIYTANTKH